MQLNLGDTINMLERAPSYLEKLLIGLPESWVHQNEGGETWSAYDVVGHLIHGEKTDWIPRTRIILGDLADKTFVPFDRFAQFENSKGKSLEELLSEFKSLRRKNLETLRSFNLSPVQLELTGIHPDFGTVTLSQLLTTWAIHDLSHTNQITRVLAKVTKAEAGPWVNYFNLLK